MFWNANILNYWDFKKQFGHMVLHILGFALFICLVVTDVRFKLSIGCDSGVWRKYQRVTVWSSIPIVVEMMSKHAKLWPFFFQPIFHNCVYVCEKEKEEKQLCRTKSCDNWNQSLESRVWYEWLIPPLLIIMSLKSMHELEVKMRVWIYLGLQNNLAIVNGYSKANWDLINVNKLKPSVTLHG